MTAEVLRFATAAVRRGPELRLFEVRRARGHEHAVLGDTVPIDRPGAVTPVRGGRLLWLRPGAWLAVVTGEPLATELNTQLTHADGASWWCFDVSDARSAYYFVGPDPLSVLNRAGPVAEALSAPHAANGPGQRLCTRLRLAQVPALVEARSASADGNPACVVWIESSVADWWWRWWQAQQKLEGGV
jgi:hypothetical protein